MTALPALADGIDLEAPGRTEKDHDRDSYNKPIELFDFWGIKEGMTVMDLFPGGGYTTHLLSMLVGPKGKVLAYASYSHESFEKRMKPLNLKNVEETVIPYPDGFSELHTHLKKLPDASLDAVITIRNYHDLTNPDEVLVELRRILKPGGILGIADSRTTKGRDPDHCRIAEDVIVEEVTGAGFELSGTSQMLSNPKDDYNRSFWDARWIVDQACLKFVR
jgi:predicted methyltransferase